MCECVRMTKQSPPPVSVASPVYAVSRIPRIRNTGCIPKHARHISHDPRPTTPRPVTLQTTLLSPTDLNAFLSLTPNQNTRGGGYFQLIFRVISSSVSCEWSSAPRACTQPQRVPRYPIPRLYICSKQYYYNNNRNTEHRPTQVVSPLSVSSTSIASLHAAKNATYTNRTCSAVCTIIGRWSRSESISSAIKSSPNRSSSFPSPLGGSAGGSFAGCSTT